MKYVIKRDMPGMVTNTFTEDAAYYSNFPFFEGELPHVFRGREKLVEVMSFLLDHQGAIEVDGPNSFSESDEHVAFQCVITSPNTGKWLANEFWLLEDDKIAHFFGYTYKLDSKSDPETPARKGGASSMGDKVYEEHMK
jgi:hypothetical protein